MGYLEIIFSLLFLTTTYFMTALGFIQSFIPMTTEYQVEGKGIRGPSIQKILALTVSLMISVVVSGVIFYVFVFPNYQVS